MTEQKTPLAPTEDDAPKSVFNVRAGLTFTLLVTVPLAAFLLVVAPFSGGIQPGAVHAPRLSTIGRTSTHNDVTRSNSNPMPPSNPSENIYPDPDIYNYCTATTIDTASGCENAALEAINHAHAAEGLAPMELPSDWASLSPAEQLFVATNLERTVRGLAPFSGMATALDQVAGSAAAANNDAQPPTGFPYSLWTSNWAGGIGSPLEAMYLWMYDDGPGSPNVECPPGGGSGCWGHRDDILAPFTCSPCVIGVGVDPNSYSGEPSWAELMVATAGSPAIDFSWSSVTWSASGSGAVVGMSASASEGYWLASANGQVHAFGGAPDYGSASLPPFEIVVGMESTPGGLGYWLVTQNGNVFAFGNAVNYGTALGVRLAAPIVGMAATPNGAGYWLVASDGGIFSFGDAVFHGSTGAMRLAKPVVGMASTSDGNGYWLVAADGGIFSFGDAVFHGSTGAMRLAKPIVGMAPTGDGNGYWLVAADGGIFSFGDAYFFGSTGALHLAAPVVGMDSPGNGYWLVAADGGVFSF
ncbi:MAG: hypothetical protein WAM97_15100, partial [Acidimicrobiales bacterium]